MAQRAEPRTVAQFKAIVKEHLHPAADDDDTAAEPDDEHCLLTISANKEDLWALECARMVVGELTGGNTSDAIDALVAEATTTLLPMIPKTDFDPDALAPSSDAQQAWNRQVEEWRVEGERRCEPRIPRWSSGPSVPTDFWPDLAIADHEALDAAVRHLSIALAARDLKLGELANRFFAAAGRHKLGYASDRRYANERLGMSASSLRAKRALARRLERLPSIRTAHTEHHIGYEATRIVSKIANSQTDAAWAERAKERTVVHLREDVSAAEILARVRNSPVAPPDEQSVNDMRKLRTGVVTGAVHRGQISAADDSVADVRRALAPSIRTPPHLRSVGRETVRLRVRPEIRRAYRALERLYLRHRPTPMTFLHFATTTLIEQNAHDLPPVEYAHIYARDGHRCVCPVCGKRHTTPHRTRFRSQGGTDDDWNVISLCADCHLGGVHRGHWSVTGPADALTWRIGNHTLVKGRKRNRLY